MSERADIEILVRRVLAAALSGVIPAEVAERRIVSAIDEEPSRALTADGKKAAMLAEAVRLEAEGYGCHVNGMVARKFADDPRNMVEVDSLRRQLSRWRKKSGHVRKSEPDVA